MNSSDAGVIMVNRQDKALGIDFLASVYKTLLNYKSLTAGEQLACGFNIQLQRLSNLFHAQPKC